MYERIVIGIDQSYARTGISIAGDGKLLLVKSIDFKGCKSNSQKRAALRRRLQMLLATVSGRAENIEIICEKIRQFSQGFINMDYIKSIGALNATIVDAASDYKVKVYSVDTRSWKSQVVGTSKPKSNDLGIAPKKYPTICFVKSLGFGKEILEPAGRKIKGVVEINGEKWVYNDDAADSACIALYGFIPKSEQKLTEEH